MLHNLYATISTFKTPADLNGSPKQVGNGSCHFPRNPSACANFFGMSLLDDGKRFRKIETYTKEPALTSPHRFGLVEPETAASALMHASSHRFKYYAGFLPTSVSDQETPFIFWAEIYFKSASHIDEMLPATKKVVEKVRKNESGTLCYLWLRDVDDEKHIFVFEMYGSREDLKVHESTEWYAEYGKKLFPFVEDYEFIGAEWKGGMFKGL